MISINNFAKSKLKCEELYLFILAVVKKLEEADPEKLHIQPEYLKLKKSLSEMEICLYKLPKTVFNKNCFNMKRKIYASHEQFINYVKSFLTNRDDNIKVAAVAISKVIQDFKIMKKTPLDTLVKNNVEFANTLSNDENKPYISILELDSYLDSYIDLNNSAKELLGMKLPMNITLRRKRRKDLVRIELERNYNKIVISLNRVVYVYINEQYISLFDWWNKYIDDTKKIIDSR